jgi:uncharacterized repeat protein (TIGR01451 family)
MDRLEDRVTPSLLATFELDGNATTGVLGTSGSTTTSHDWDQIFADAGSPSALGGASFTNGISSGALAGSFTRDVVNSTADDIFTGGGSKDTNGIQNWLFTAAKPQGKDDIANAFAGAYTDSGTGHLLLYAGLDRFDNSGNSTAGFWFFGNQIGQNPNVTQNGGHPFTGQHRNGDILLISNFTQGGSVSTIAVYEWVGNDSTGQLQFIGGNSSNTFAIVNGAPINVPWSYTNKAGQTQPQAGEFLEEGVDLTALGLSGCFDTFLAETRSSQSPTATLSDFTLGSFPVCTITATPFQGLSKFDTFTNQGDVVTYPLTVTNTGAVKLYVQNVSDTLLGNIVVNGVVQQPGAAGVNSSVTSITAPGLNSDGSLAPGASVTFFVTRPVQATDPDPTTDTVTFVYNDDPGPNFGPDQDTASATNSVNLFQPSVSMTETASPKAGVVGTPITYTYTVTNTSSSDSPNLVLDTSNPNDSFTSTLFGNIEADAIHAATGNNTATTASLAPGASFSFTETHVLTAGDPIPLTDSTTAAFTLDQGLGSFPNVIHAAASATTRTVNAEISIVGSGVNEVNNPHTFTVTVNEDVGDGNGFVPAPNVPVTVTLTNTNGSTTSPTTFNVTTNASGQATVTFTSATAGEVIGNASTTFSILGVTLTRATGDSNVGDSGPVTKFFEDATISIAPNATNGITEPHTFTVTVLDNAGDGNGFVAAANEPVMVTLTGQNGAVPIAETPLSGTTDANGQIQVTFTSDSAGQVLGNASTSFTLNGVTLTRATGDGLGEVGFVDSGPATKTFVAGSLRWEKVDGNGQLLGGATFLVTAIGGTAAGLSPTSVTVTDNGPSDANPTPGLFELDKFQGFGGSSLTGLALGTYTIQEITPPTGYTLDPKVLTVTLTQSSLTGDVTGTPFVDTLPTLTITKAVSVGSPTVIHPGDTASYTITVNNTGAGTAQNLVVTDNLPDADMLTWTATSSDFTTSISGGVLTATDASLVGGATASITVSAAVPLNFFGNPGTGTGNGDPVPLGLFELDGNATTGVLGTSGSTTTSHDWDQVFADNTANPPTNTAGALASSFSSDETTGDDILTGGSTKDTLPLSGWAFKTGKPQDKDEISNAFAAEYKDPATGDQILYAGLDRFSNSGDSTAGFWFFVNPVSKSVTGNVGGSGASFNGTHHDGDLLLISDFTVGGSVSTIRVFRWTGNDATGSLVPIDNGNPISGSTFAIVNSGPISVPWSFKDKAGFSHPQAGEFLEEGVNLTGLGLNGCFSSFMAETRSSQSTTATLSDFILGPNFNTCNVTLPNVASVSASNFNNGQPITSNEVIITLNDGMPELAASLGSGAATASLTEAQLQPAVAQAVAAWRAAGADPSALSNIANYAIHIANLPDGELGYEVPGQIWIDATAQGWGWSTTGAPGEMDLTTVVTHEVGHMLGFGDCGSGVMETALAPGMRVAPEALAGIGVGTFVVPGTSVNGVGLGSGTTAGGAPGLFGAGATAIASPVVPLSATARPAASDTASATAVSIVMLPTAAASFQIEVGTFRGLAGVPLSLAPSILAVPAAVMTTPAGVPARSDREIPSDIVLASRPPVGGVVGTGDHAELTSGEGHGFDPWGGLPAWTNPGDWSLDQHPETTVDPELWHRALDACLDDGAWMANLIRPDRSLPQVDARLDDRGWMADFVEPDSPLPQDDANSGTTAAVFALVLGGCWGTHRAGPRWRKGRHLLVSRLRDHSPV